WWCFIPVMEAQRGAGEAKDRPVKPAVPELHLHLLDVDLAEDIVSTYRRREAAWISLATHGVIIALLLLVPKWTRNQAVIVPLTQNPKNMMLIHPDTLQNPKPPPKTNKISKKARLASSKPPSLDKDTLRKLREASRRPGVPKPAAQPPAQQAAQQTPAPAPPAPAQQPAPQQTAQLEAPKPAAPKTSPFKIASPGSSVSQAIQSVANGHAAGVEYGSSGDYGSTLHPKTDRHEGMEILSDTLGVGFGPYMKRLHYT